MGKVFWITIIVFFAGCVNSTPPLRNQIDTGMTLSEVWELWGGTEGLANLKSFPWDTVNKEETDNCTVRTDRYWLLRSRDRDKLFAKPTPFLLTFRSCKLDNYEEVEQMRKQKLKAVFEADPDFKEKFDALCEKFEVTSKEGKEIMFYVLLPHLFEDIPPSMTEFTLISIKDEPTNK